MNIEIYKQKAINIAKQKNGNCIPDDYENYLSYLIWTCENNHTWKAQYSKVQQGRWCAKCIYESKLPLKIKELIKIAEQRGGKYLSDKYIGYETKLEFMCKNNHKWFSTPHSIKSGKWCIKCAGLEKLNIQIAQELATSKDGICLSSEYTNSNSNLLWQCHLGHQWEAPLSRIKNLKTWCPCCRRFINEEKCRFIFESIFKTKFLKTRSILPSRLELDGYNEDVKIAFEYNGEQHYKIHYFSKSDKDLEKIKKKDLIKQYECKKLNIQLITIPYYAFQNDSDICKFIFEKLKINYIDIDFYKFYKMHGSYANNLSEEIINNKSGKIINRPNSATITIKCKNDHIWTTKQEYINSGSWCPICVNKNIKHTIQKMQDIAMQRNGKCLSDVYINSKTKLKWECAYGHVWEAVPSNVIRKTWCRVCSNKNQKGRPKKCRNSLAFAPDDLQPLVK